MKKLLEKVDAETLWGFIFGIITIVAIIIEIALGGFNAASVAGGVKDAAGTLVSVLVFFVAVKALVPKKQKGFKNVFNTKMNELAEKYFPVIKQSESNAIEYSIADNLSCLYGKNSGAYHRFFLFSEGDNSITFSASKTVFFGRTQDDHSKELEGISLDISKSIAFSFADFVKEQKSEKDSFTLVFQEPLSSDESAKRLANVIDKILLLYVARCTKA